MIMKCASIRTFIQGGFSMAPRLSEDLRKRILVWYQEQWKDHRKLLHLQDAVFALSTTFYRVYLYENSGSGEEEANIVVWSVLII